MLSKEKCQECECTSIVSDKASGSRVCEGCGYVLEESIVRSEVSPGDWLPKTGSFVSTEYSGGGLHAGRHGLRGPIISGNESNRSKLLANDKVRGICQLLRLPSKVANEGFTMLALAVNTKWGRGRWVDLLAASCIYIVCRRANIPLSLIDVAGSIQCDVFTLGRTYTKLLGLLDCGPLPTVDPVIYIEKACQDLGIVDVHPGVRVGSNNPVAQCAVQLLDIAKDEWLTSGRNACPLAAASLALSLNTYPIIADAVFGRARKQPKLPMREAMEGRSVDRLNRFHLIGKVEKVLGVSHKALTTRLRELIDCTLRCARDMPWSSDVSSDNIEIHLPAILEYINLHRRTSRCESPYGQFDATCSSNGQLPLLLPPCNPLALPHTINNAPHPAELFASSTPIPYAISWNRNRSLSPSVHSQSCNTDTDWRSESVEDASALMVTPYCGQSSSSALPPSFLKGSAEFEARKRKVARVQRILQARLYAVAAEPENKCYALESRHPTANSDLPVKSKPLSGDGDLGRRLSCDFPLEKTEQEDNEMDREDLVISRLLLHGVSPEVLAEGYYNEPSPAMPSSSPSLTENDVTDRELASLVRTDYEVELLQENMSSLAERPIKRSRWA